MTSDMIREELYELSTNRNLTDFVGNLTRSRLSFLEGLSIAGIQCYTQSWMESDLNPMPEPHCDASWDGRHCWPRALVNETITLPCTDSMGRAGIGNSDPFKGRGYAFRTCSEEEGLWGNWSNYSPCPNFTSFPQSRPLLEFTTSRTAVALVLFIGSVLSLISLSIALGIFQYFKNIHCERITIHIHFMMALALKCIVFILISEAVIFGRTIKYFRINWICKLLTTLQLYAALASVNWMFVQGHYLNSRMTSNIFSRKRPIKYYVLFGWGGSLLPVLLWSGLMESLYKVRCWKGYGKSNLIWIILAPLLGVLLANLVFLGNIIRVLLTKIQLTSHDTESQQFMRAMKATVGLFPLLGLNILLFFYNPGGTWQPYYMLVNAIVHSLQGLFVAVFYCFMCHDVRGAVRREYRRLILTRRRSSLFYDTGLSHSMATNALLTRLREREQGRANNKETTVVAVGDAKYISGPARVVINPVKGQQANHFV